MNTSVAKVVSSPSKMTSAQRWQTLLNRQPADRVPCDYWSTGEFTDKLKIALNLTGRGDEAIWDRLQIDRPGYVGPRWKLKHHPDDSQANMWGIRVRSISYGTGEYGETDNHPLAHFTTLADVENYRWPSPNDFDFAPVTAACLADDGSRILHGPGYEPFLLYCSLRGLEQGLMDLIECPDLAHAILGKIFDFYYELNRRVLEAGNGKIELFYLAEDLAGQHGPLFSLDAYREFLRPNQKKMAALARSFGAHIFYHTDGAARAFIPDLIEEVGIEILNPLQWRCAGMELPGLVRDFGKHLIFHGGIDNQQTLAFGTVAEVRREVRDVATIMAAQRWICAPCHNIQAVSPAENIIAMYEELHTINRENATH